MQCHIIVLDTTGATYASWHAREGEAVEGNTGILVVLNQSFY